MNNVDLSRSICDIQQGPQLQEKVGSHICDKMETLLAGAIALQKVAEVASEHGNRGICTGITLATGITCLAHGNVVMGGIATFAGLKEAINIWREINPKSDIASLLNDANTGVDMIKTLEEANSESFKIVDANLDIIRKKVQKMNDRMEKIKSISTEGQQDIEKIKAEAAELYEEAEDQFSTAKNSFKLSQSRLKQANKIFIRSLQQFDDLFTLAQTADITDKEKLNQFVAIAKKIQKQCQAAQAVLKEGSQQIETGLQALDIAQDKEREAYGQSLVAMERAKNKLELISVQAQAKREYEKKVDETKEEIDHIQERNQDIKTLLNELSSDLKSAKKLSDDKFGTMSVIFGVVPGAVTGFGVGG